MSAAAAGPAIVGGAIMVGTGLAVGKVFKVVRRKVAQHQAARRDVELSAEGLILNREEETVQVELVLRGRAVFTAGKLASIRASLEIRGQLDRAEARLITRELRELEFYVSDWAPPGQRLTTSDFDRLVAAGFISEGTDE